MSFYAVQGLSTVYQYTTAGTSLALTPPTGVTIDSTLRLRGAVMSGAAVLVGSPSENIAMDSSGILRRLCPRPPTVGPIIAGGSSGTLSGTYQVWVTFKIKDSAGNILAESDFSPASNSVTIASKMLRATSIPTTSEQIPTGTSFSRQLYRSTTDGSVKFPWLEVDGNTITSVEDDLSDAGLSLVAAPTDLGMPPKFDLIVEWKDRLWGKSVNEVDILYQSGIGKSYAWPISRTIPIPPRSADLVGISGFLRRKDELGVGRRSALHKIVGTNITNFTRQVVTDRLGIWAPDSCVTIDDVGYFLGSPFAVYAWGPTGVANITNERVKAWFDTDTYFNRAEFDNAIGMYEPATHSYILFLSAVGSTDLDRWIQFDIATGAWWGPHKTAAFTPYGGTALHDANEVQIACWFGSDGKLYKQQTTKTDGASSGIDFDVTTNWFSGNTPDIFKTWLNPSIISKIQSASTLTVTPSVGGLDASAGTAISHDMTLGRQMLRVLGNGRLARLRMQNSTAAQPVVVYGLELPFFENGRR